MRERRTRCWSISGHVTVGALGRARAVAVLKRTRATISDHIRDRVSRPFWLVVYVKVRQYLNIVLLSRTYIHQLSHSRCYRDQRTSEACLRRSPNYRWRKTQQASMLLRTSCEIVSKYTNSFRHEEQHSFITTTRNPTPHIRTPARTLWWR
jgi:hypothetical protein